MASSRCSGTRSCARWAPPRALAPVYATALCEPGEIVVGGGLLNQSAVSRADGYEIIASSPRGGEGEAATGWSVGARAGEAGNIGDTPTAYMVCLPIK